FVDDTLNEHELDVICGVYRLMPSKIFNSSGGPRATDSTSYVSWWPPVAIWENSSCNIGYWTPSHEDWFQDRLAKIKDGTGRPKTALGWK
ncbi:hypothetical protein BC629DRAFT_1264435, partial [Irpex lacteus]